MPRLPPGAAILLSGEPGVGKSTLLLEVASRAAASGQRVLYVSAEESVSQVRLRAERTNALQPSLFLAAETDLATILGQIDEVQPQLVIVDSVQTGASGLTDGLAGGPAQVREVASTLIRVSKDRNLPVLLVGHVTKDGTIAGPRLLEHLVDVVLQFEGDRQTSLRFVRAHKSRFGPTDEVGCFEMTGDGISEVADPSGLFLSRARRRAARASRSPSRGGGRCRWRCRRSSSRRRPPSRGESSTGWTHRASRCCWPYSNAGRTCRSLGSTSTSRRLGGVRVSEPGADLAIALAVGQISLAGEIRPASSGKQRLAEAKRLGFSQVLHSETVHLREALRLALAGASAERVDVPDF